MHDLRMVRDQVAALRDGMRRRGKLEQFGPVIDEAEALDRERRTTITAVEEKKARRNTMTQEVGRLKKAVEHADEVMAAARALGDEIAAMEARLVPTEDRLTELLLGVPNVTLADVPEIGRAHV